MLISDVFLAVSWVWQVVWVKSRGTPAQKGNPLGVPSRERGRGGQFRVGERGRSCRRQRPRGRVWYHKQTGEPPVCTREEAPVRVITMRVPTKFDRGTRCTVRVITMRVPTKFDRGTRCTVRVITMRVPTKFDRGTRCSSTSSSSASPHHPGWWGGRDHRCRRCRHPRYPPVLGHFHHPRRKGWGPCRRRHSRRRRLHRWRFGVRPLTLEALNLLQDMIRNSQPWITTWGIYRTSPWRVIGDQAGWRSYIAFGWDPRVFSVEAPCLNNGEEIGKCLRSIRRWAKCGGMTVQVMPAGGVIHRVERATLRDGTVYELRSSYVSPAGAPGHQRGEHAVLLGRDSSPHH